jgi:uncharacterized ion transporter superfamily protein YfcC
MKRCAYCGRSNDTSVTSCVGCGSADFASEQDSVGDEMRLMQQAKAPDWRTWMSSPVAVYRTLIVVSFATYIAWFLFPLVENQFLSEDKLYLLGAHGYGAILPIPLRISWLLFFINLAVAPGLWFFAKSARWVYVAIVIFFVAITPLGGMKVEAPLSTFLAYINTLVDGALIILSFVSPFRERFEASAETSPLAQ